MQRRTAVAAHFKSKQLLLFSLALQYCRHLGQLNEVASAVVCCDLVLLFKSVHLVLLHCVQRQKAVSAYLQSKQILPFGCAEYLILSKRDTFTQC